MTIIVEATWHEDTATETRKYRIESPRRILGVTVEKIEWKWQRRDVGEMRRMLWQLRLVRFDYDCARGYDLYAPWPGVWLLQILGWGLRRAVALTRWCDENGAICIPEQESPWSWHALRTFTLNPFTMSRRVTLSRQPEPRYSWTIDAWTTGALLDEKLG